MHVIKCCKTNNNAKVVQSYVCLALQLVLFVLAIVLFVCLFAFVFFLLLDPCR